MLRSLARRRLLASPAGAPCALWSAWQRLVSAEAAPAAADDADGVPLSADGVVRRVPMSRVRNFSIIAHVDHGKSTLADALLLHTGTLAARDAAPQYLDNLELERERGITIKLQTVRMHYRAKSDGLLYVLNLIDTPGHVDFSFEVSRSLAACEGALLVVDASQGVEAQTVANVLLALEGNLTIVPVLNKVDLPGAEPERVKQEVASVLGLDASGAVLASAKLRTGIGDILEAVVARVPPPGGDASAPLRALIFDSYYESYRGVIVLLRVVDGVLRKGALVRCMNTGAEHEVLELGVMSPGQKQVTSLLPGEVGYLAANIKRVADARVGDTVTLAGPGGAAAPLPGYAEAAPMVFAGLYPADGEAYGRLRESLERLQLSDAALSFEPETSSAMGFGFRCGFLGLLHMEIVQQRLEREYGLDLVATAPGVAYRVTLADGSVVVADSAARLPPPELRAFIEEPFVALEVMTPASSLGAVMRLCQERRGQFVGVDHLPGGGRACVRYAAPLAEVVTDFFDELKSVTRGYATMSYAPAGHRRADLVLLELRLNGEPCDALAVIVHRDAAYGVGRSLVAKLKELIPRHQFEVPIQACVGGRVLASERLSALRKNVLAKCYGGDISRKKKLLQKQAEGKKRMRSVGSVELPQEAFLAVLRLGRADKA